MFGFLLPLGVVIAIILIIIAIIMETKSSSNKGQVIRSVYFYLASLITLGFVVGSLVVLLTLGFQTWVFSEADPILSRIGPPPSVFLSTKAAPIESSNEVILACEEKCEFSEGQKRAVETWERNYELWKERRANPAAERGSDAVAALSFLIIALPFYFIHFRIVQKDARKDKEKNKEPGVIRNTFFYLVSLASLLMIVIAGGILINVALKTWVFPSTERADKVASRIVEPVSESRNDILGIINCGGICEFNEDTVIAAETWLVDYDAWQQEGDVYNNSQRRAADNIPFIIVGIPLFWYHWTRVRQERNKKADITAKEDTN